MSAALEKRKKVKLRRTNGFSNISVDIADVKESHKKLISFFESVKVPAVTGDSTKSGQKNTN